jgi:hypothetical protein
MSEVDFASQSGNVMSADPLHGDSAHGENTQKVATGWSSKN